MNVGIIVCGGESLRMGSDKSLITYHKEPQRYHLYNLLKAKCDATFISLNRNQKELTDHVIVDDPQYENHGPISGLLSVAKKVNASSYIFIGCDYPFLKTEHIDQLLKANNDSLDAVCFSANDQPEPLLAIYNQRAIEKLLIQYQKAEYSLSRFLKKEKVLFLEKDMALISIDTPEQFQETKSAFTK